MSRGKCTRKPCDVRHARLRLVDARQFLEAAELLDALGERSSDGNHGSAVDLLRQVDATLATAL